MQIRWPKISFPFFERDVKGNTFYDVNEFKGWALWNGTNLDLSLNHPILTPAMLFLTKLFSQAEFYIENKKTGEKTYDHWILDLLQNPNYYQTKNDFLETALWMQIAEGVAVGWMRKTTGMSQGSTLYILDPNYIKWPDDFKSPMSRLNDKNGVKRTKIIYEPDGETTETIPIEDLIFWYDTPNGLANPTNLFEVEGRIKGLRQTLLNTFDSLVAKNIILKSNGKEMISGNGNGEGFPFKGKEKEDAEKVISENYGLSYSRKRGLVTAANIKWQSMHIALRDLGLDESIKVDGNIIYSALHIPKDILSLEAKKTTYNNFKESMVSFIQNEMQPTLNSFLAPLDNLLEDKNLCLRGGFDKMPIMQFILIEKYDGLIKKGQALSALRSAGLPDEIALEECGYDTNIQLKELTLMQNGNEQNQQEESGAGNGNDEEEGEDD